MVSEHATGLQAIATWCKKGGANIVLENRGWRAVRWWEKTKAGRKCAGARELRPIESEMVQKNHHWVGQR